ncbi:hypothetical protein B484DRAFT_422032 [Ochromonadaceae sp. CCMP2298]|nr:hypothetical protein B484DRAFT_422032 [Ochromonadaceae sp. CCMP2298]
MRVAVLLLGLLLCSLRERPATAADTAAPERLASHTAHAADYQVGLDGADLQSVETTVEAVAEAEAEADEAEIEVEADADADAEADAEAEAEADAEADAEVEAEAEEAPAEADAEEAAAEAEVFVHVHIPEHFCNKGTRSAFSIPASRVGDGVCDCCDGSDEAALTLSADAGADAGAGDMPGADVGAETDTGAGSQAQTPTRRLAECAAACESDLMRAKKAALSYHRNVQAGLRTRTQITEGFKTKRAKDTNLVQTLTLERELVDKMQFRMKFLLSRERVREQKLRFKLVREREARCAGGDELACQYFYGAFFEADELIHEGFPLEYANPRVRFQYEYSAKELSELSLRSGLERVKLSICPAQQLLPDDDARIFTQVGEYLNFESSPGGRAARAPTPRSRRLNTLFGEYTENGNRGLLQLQMVVLEGAGLLLAPLTLGVRGAWGGIGWVRGSVWGAVGRCASGAGTSAFISTSDYSLSTLCQLLLDTEAEGTPASNLLSLLDYSRYSLLGRWANSLESILETPLWMGEIIVRTPSLYWDFYIGKEGELPPRRQCCLLRSGIESASRELDLLDERIAAQEDLQQQSALKRVIRRSHDADLSGKRETVVPLDFSPDGSWEAVLGNCFTAEGVEGCVGDVEVSGCGGDEEEEGKRYSFCYFGEMREIGVGEEEGVSLGSFLHWGPPEGNMGTYAPLLSVGAIGNSSETAGVTATVKGTETGTTDASSEAGAGTVASASAAAANTLQWAYSESLALALSTIDYLEYSLKRASSRSFMTGASVGLRRFLDQSARVAKYVLGACRELLSGGASGAGAGGAGVWRVTLQAPSFEQYYARLRAGPKGMEEGWGRLGGQGEAGAGAEGMAGAGMEGVGIEAVAEADFTRASLQQRYYSTQVYTGGSLCSFGGNEGGVGDGGGTREGGEGGGRGEGGEGGPIQHRRRASVVQLRCGMSHDVTEVTEVEPCLYRVVVTSPLVCSALLHEQSLAQLQALGVFGFAKNSP